MIIIHKLEMDLAARGAMPRIDVVQGDTNTRVLELALLCAGEEWPVPEGCAVWLRYCKSDGTKGVYDTMPDGTSAWSAEGSRIRMTLAPQMMTAAGSVLAQLELVRGVCTVATFTVQIAVERNPAAGAVTSEDYVNMLQWMEGELDRLLAEAMENGDMGTGEANVFLYAQKAGYSGTEEAFCQQLITPCLPLAGGTMEGSLSMGGKHLTGLASPEADTDAVTKAHVDGRGIVTRVEFPHSAWNNVAPHYLDVEIPGLRAGDWVHLQPIFPEGAGDIVATKNSFQYLSCWEAGDGVLHVTCLDHKPQLTLSLFCQILHMEASV